MGVPIAKLLTMFHPFSNSKFLIVRVVGLEPTALITPIIAHKRNLIRAHSATWCIAAIITRRQSVRYQTLLLRLSDSK